MMNTITNMNIGEQTHLPSFNELSREIPLTNKARRLVMESRDIIRNIITGQDKRQLLIVGPCSVHNLVETLEFARLLKQEMQIKQSSHYIVMRVCFDKPRTKKDWPGYMPDPRLDGSYDTAYGYRSTRQLMADILELGIPIACEMLDINDYNVVSDMMSYAWIGARTVASPVSRIIASGITAPVGVKNSNSKDTFDDSTNALDVITKPGVFTCAGDDGYHSRIPTKGNRYGHVILRGSRGGPNYSSRHVRQVRAELKSAGFIDRVLIDCSHGNANGDYKKQVVIFKNIARRIMKGEEGIMGVMMEVYLDGGQQKVKLGVPGVAEHIVPRLSVTDKCLSFEEFRSAFRQVLQISN
jgi:3-deoxy-7-phosphoheptulonate synthase